MKTKRLLGYQLYNEAESEMPEQMFSFGIYSLEECQTIQEQEPGRWKLLEIYDGDIEDPTMCTNFER